MIIIEVKKNNIEQALKQYKFKVYKTKQLEFLRDRQEFEKKSVKNRKQKIKAVYLQKKRNHLSSCFLSTFFLWVKKSTEVRPKVPKANKPIVSIKISGASYFPQLNKETNKAAIKEILHKRPINLFEDIPPLAPSIIFLKN